MTDDTQRSTRRWLLILFVVAALLWIRLLSQLGERNADRELGRWRDHARAAGIETRLLLHCRIPALERITLARRLLDEFRVEIVVSRESQVAEIISLPECPVPFTFSFPTRLPENCAAQLRTHFGPESVP